MKFGKQLEDDAIAEWKGRYLDYRVAKGILKAVGRAYRNLPSYGGSRTPTFTSLRDAISRSDRGRKTTRSQRSQPPNSVPSGASGGDGSTSWAPTSLPLSEQARLASLRLRQNATAAENDPQADENDDLAPLQRPERPENAILRRPEIDRSHTSDIPATSTPEFSPQTKAKSRKDQPSLLRRIASNAGSRSPVPGRTNEDITLQAYQEFDLRKAEFFQFLDDELAKIESFYRFKEEEAVQRLDILRNQLRIMDDSRWGEHNVANQDHAHADTTPMLVSALDGLNDSKKSAERPGHDAAHDSDRRHTRDFIADQLKKSVSFVADVFHQSRVSQDGNSAEATNKDGVPHPRGHSASDDSRRDYARRPSHEVPYQSARRKLKSALTEYYRSLELQKSYALLNYTAFRKIIKKFDKTTDAQTKSQYMDGKVGKSHFVNSNTIDNLMKHTVELYAEYFEAGIQKLAVGKLRTTIPEAVDCTTAVARTCVFLTAGLILSIFAVVNAKNDLSSSAVPGRSAHAEYLLQLYGGYFLIVLMAGLFCLDAGIFSLYKVNYPFILELERKSQLHWLQLSEIPAWFFFLQGIIMWLNFLHAGGDRMYLYWFVVLLGLAAASFTLPIFGIYRRTLTWFLYSCWRLVFSGLYKVEFRDFFIGDLACSLTYAMGNIELFFCLYADQFRNVSQCNSSHSRLMGFLSALPAVWRALQCLRRVRDSREWHPHLPNFGKYMFSVLYYASLSVYRIDKIVQYKAFFIVCATINAVYCSIWDVLMDWNLSPSLRETLVYRKHLSVYYVAMILDPILRNNWIFYAIYTENLQHSSLVSFLVSLSEVMRRGMWIIFRVEKEQSENVDHERAIREPTLPYEIDEHSRHSLDELRASQVDGSHHHRPADASAAAAPSTSSQSGHPLASVPSRLSLATRRNTMPAPSLRDGARLERADDGAPRRPGGRSALDYIYRVDEARRHAMRLPQHKDFGRRNPEPRDPESESDDD